MEWSKDQSLCQRCGLYIRNLRLFFTLEWYIEQILRYREISLWNAKFALRTARHVLGYAASVLTC